MSQVFGNQAEGSERGYTVLAVAVQESVLGQYESLCESVGLIPFEVGITSLQLVNLWKRISRGGGWLHRRAMDDASRSLADDDGLSMRADRVLPL
ncbi:MAG: hypothetical protein U0223_09175 [Nitrospira sp.]